MNGRRVSAIVLAGGRSSRFGRDKLAEPVGGRTLLEHAVEAVRSSVHEVIVVVAPDATPAIPSDVHVARDPAPFEGPLAGLMAGLGEAREGIALVTAGDMPELQAPVVEALLRALDVRGVEAAVLEDAGLPRPLPMAVARDPAMRETQRLLGTGERRLRALVDALATTVIDEATWRALDPDGRSLRDIDTPDDLR
jgi:molybdopterin-guanine dinucleotide biosynthesis protein A